MLQEAIRFSISGRAAVDAEASETSLSGLTALRVKILRPNGDRRVAGTRVMNRRAETGN